VEVKLEGSTGVFPDWSRERIWRCQRTSVVLIVARDFFREAGLLHYLGVLYLAADDEGSFPATLEFRGRRWWLGKPGPLARHVLSSLDDIGEFGEAGWTLSLSDADLSLWFEEHAPLAGLGWEVFSTLQLHAVDLSMRQVHGGDRRSEQDGKTDPEDAAASGQRARGRAGG